MQPKPTTPVRCISCAHMTLRDHPGTTTDKSRKAAEELAKLGMGRCLHGDHFLFVSVTRERACTRHEPAEQLQVARREKWLQHQDMQHALARERGAWRADEQDAA